MKSSDPLLQDWEKTLARKRDAPAIFATSGEVLRTFGDVEQRARELLRSIDVFHEGSVLAVQIGNHEDWPSVLIACLRRHLVVLPLEQSISEQQRDEALEICKVKAVVSAVPERRYTRDHSAGDSRLHTRLARESAKSPKAYLRHNGHTPRNPLS